MLALRSQILFTYILFPFLRGGHSRFFRPIALLACNQKGSRQKQKSKKNGAFFKKDYTQISEKIRKKIKTRTHTWSYRHGFHFFEADLIPEKKNKCT